MVATLVGDVVMVGTYAPPDDKSKQELIELTVEEFQQARMNQYTWLWMGDHNDEQGNTVLEVIAEHYGGKALPNPEGGSRWVTDKQIDWLMTTQAHKG